jgi:type IV pilus assembly protein PilB
MSVNEVTAVLTGRAIDLQPEDVPEEMFSLMPHELGSALRAVPFARDGETVLVAMVDPDDMVAADDVRFSLSPADVALHAAPEDLVNAVLLRWGRTVAARAEGAVVSEITPGAEDVDAEDESDENGTMARLVGQVIDQAVELEASDVHVEPAQDRIVVRFRVDGVMRVHNTYPARIHRGLTNRIKIMANLDISERRLPQDGRFNRVSAGKSIDIRVATVPTAWGAEKSVLRLFNQSRTSRSLDQVGFHDHLVRDLKKVLEAPNGLILVTGPTGSGKTTTLYAALDLVATPERNTMAVEDPVEIRNPAITQVQVHVSESIKLTFARVLRSFLRSDPDVILVGEIRDLETAELAVQAAQTGHLVLSTLHTNSAAGVPSRLKKLGLTNTADISDTLRAVLAQRLVRQVCPACSYEYAPSDEDFALVDWPADLERPAVLRRASATGCAVCNSPDGYRGRLVVGELITVDDELATSIEEGASAREIERLAHKKGTRSLHLDALAWLSAGRTTIDELRRIGL